MNPPDREAEIAGEGLPATHLLEDRVPLVALAAMMERAREQIARLWERPAGVDEFIAELSSDEIDGSYLAQRYIAGRCACGDSRAIAWFERDCIATLGPALGRIDPSPAFVDEIRQRVRAKLLVASDDRPPRIAEYAGRGPLGAWVRVVAVRAALAARRQQTPVVAAEELLDVGASLTSPELGLLKEHYREEFQRAFAAALAALSPEQRNLLRHHYLHGLTLDQLANLQGMHRSSVARRIAKIRAELLTATRRSLMASLATGPEEFEQLMALIASRIDLSIERHLAG